MKVNPMQLIQLMKRGKSPQQLVMSILQQNNSNNPIIQNAVNLAQNGNTAALKSLGENLAAQRGLNFDKEFADFKNYFK